MRVPAFAIAAIFFVTVPVAAQDLQFRMQLVATATTPGGPTVAPVMTTSMKGNKVRVDNQIVNGGDTLRSSIIMDDSTKKVQMLMHDRGAYMEVDDPFASAGAQNDSMTKMLRAGAPQPEIIRTGERSTIAGFAAERSIITVLLPTGAIPGARQPLLAVMEIWAATDATLNSIYRPFAERSANLTAGQMPGVEKMLIQVGFPLRTTHLLLPAPTTKVDPVAILKQTAPEGLVMKTVMEVQDVKLGPLADSLFVVPNWYSKMTGGRPGPL
jgi:hypothetical protein